MTVGQIRQATTNDAPALLALINRAFAVEKFFVDRDRITAEPLHGYLSSGTFFLLYDNDGSPAASLFFEERGDRAYVGMLSVDPLGYRRRRSRAGRTGRRSRRVKA